MIMGAWELNAKQSRHRCFPALSLPSVNIQRVVACLVFGDGRREFMFAFVRVYAQTPKKYFPHAATHMKKPLSLLPLVSKLLLSLVVLLTISAVAHAQSGTTANGLDYTASSGRITITGYSGTSGAVSIPSTIPGVIGTVTSIGQAAFSDCFNLTSVKIPSSVTAIGENAFFYCLNLNTVTIPKGVTNIGINAFLGCSSLIAITVTAPNPSYISVGGVLFNRNETTLIQYPARKSGSSYVIPNSVISIEENAFYESLNLTSVTIPNSVTSIGGFAFYESSNLTNVTIPKSVTNIGELAFGDCARLNAITVTAPNPSYISIGGVLFNRSETTLIQYPALKSGTSYIIPKSVTSIEAEAFLDCGSLKSVIIPNGVTSIGDEAFEGDGSLTSVTMPNSVSSIGDQAFLDCSSLKSVTIPNRVTSLGHEVFCNCTSLTTVTIPNSVTAIGGDALSYCSSLKSVTIADSVTSIAAFAFEDDRGLTSVTIPSRVTSIGNYAFGNCQLTSAVFMGNAPTMGANVFESNTGTFAVYYFKGATGFNSPIWTDSSGDRYAAVSVQPK